ncbi:sulfite exporter TauE/SafE family protein [Georgenia sp. SYP-B2076]|uniref:sulfite exporter TauE/SafE family protein n=1 Tax=Georgenia sp. SYP-B2076 TaxID=2495881 RepID=UPI003515B69D
MMRPTAWWRLAIIGVVAGFFSGLFGVGGGVLIVPLLIMLAHFDQRRASGTSLTAILPTAIAGAAGYAVRGEIDLIAAICVAGGAVGGSFVGAWLLHRIPQRVLRWIFVAFLVLMAARMALSVPDRGAEIELGIASVLALAGLGLLTGVLSGLLGVGGGVIVVPVLIVLFGMGDLVAKGTSLLMMIPISVTGTVANVRRGNSDVRAAVILGLLAVPASLAGVAVATTVPPQLGAILFAVLLLFTAVQLGARALRTRGCL